MKPRSAVTLIETLIAIFIMGVGLLALLTLFPLGALNMAQAIKDDRCAHANTNAHAIANAINLRKNPDVLAAMRMPATSLPTGPLQGPAATQLPNRTARGPSWPVFVDPLGFRAHLGQGTPAGVRQYWVGGTIGTVAQGGLRRCSISNVATDPNAVDAPNLSSAATTLPQLIPYTTFLDDVTLLDNGRPNLTEPGAVERQGRYSWAWVCQLRNAAATANQVVDLQVVVFSRRTLDFGTTTGPETWYAATFQPNQRTATLTWAAGTEKPVIRRGGWVLDASPPVPQLNTPQGKFYRVVNVTDVSATSMEVEFQAKPAGSANRPGRVVIMQNVVEVFNKGTF